MGLSPGGASQGSTKEGLRLNRMERKSLQLPVISCIIVQFLWYHDEENDGVVDDS